MSTDSAILRADYYARLAALNFYCADEADKTVGRLPGFEFAAPPPVMPLCAHSIELSLKSIPLRSGRSEAEFRNFRHDLVACYEEAEIRLAKNGDALPEIDKNILRIVSDLLVSGTLRYGDAPKIGRVPSYGALAELVNVFLRLCKAPDLEGLAE